MAFEFTDQNVEEVIATGKPVVVDCWATWCGPCMALAPTIEKLAEEFEGQAVIGKYNTEEENDFAVENRVMALPTILFFKGDKKAKFRLTGAQSADVLRAKIKELIDL